MQLHKKYSVSPEILKATMPTPHASSLHRQWHFLLASHLVPGGRYLVIATGLGFTKVRIELLDLGVPADSQGPVTASVAVTDVDMGQITARCKMDVAFVNDEVLQVAIIPSSVVATPHNRHARTRTL